MPPAVYKKKHRSRPRLNKRFVARHDGYDVYTVNAYAVRCVAQPDEEFANFATHKEFPTLIPKGQIWLSDKNLDKEGVFFIANAVTRLKEENGKDEEKAYTAGLTVERLLREKINKIRFRNGKPHARVPPAIYVEPYITLPDPEFPVQVWVVDGNLVRSYYKTDYTEGGHGYVYRWVPKDQIWIEKDLDRGELPYIVSHEYIEMRLMRDDGIEYDQAHEICSKLEFKLRKGRGLAPLLVPRRRRVLKRDLPRLCSEDVHRYVVGHYLQ